MGFGDHNFNLPEGQDFAPAPTRVAELVGIMSPTPFYPGLPATERDRWEVVRKDETGRWILAEARMAAGKTPRLHLTDDIYRECLKRNDPAPYNNTAPEVHRRMALMTLAECLEPTGGYLPVIEEDIVRAARRKTWVHPDNDNNRDSFEGRSIFNDLGSVQLGATLVGADRLLGDQLRPEIRTLIRKEVKRRVLDPFRERIESGKDVYWWFTVTHNWNTVCVLHTLVCALGLLDDPRDRAWHLAVAEKLIRYSEEGFGENGFYTEGVSYWNSGFGSYVVLAEVVRAVTGGGIDWMNAPRVKQMAQFGHRMEIQDGVYPSFADCKRDVKTPVWLDNWLNNRIDDSRTDRSTSVKVNAFSGANPGSLLPTLLILFHQEDFRNVFEYGRSTGLREWFEDAQFLICRPGREAGSKLASTFKGGHNGVNHNHNDLGSFSVLVDGRKLLTDPGAEVYSERTFSARRFESDLLNSFGHSVPVVAGQLQSPGKGEFRAGSGSEFCAFIIGKSFTDDADRVVLDLKSAYRVDTLVSLTRSFTHSRSQKGRVLVVDEVSFSRPETFETALITFGDWQQVEDGLVLISQDGAVVEVRVDSEDGELIMDSCVIEESSTPSRLSWRFAEPLRAARITIEVKPAEKRLES